MYLPTNDPLVARIEEMAAGLRMVDVHQHLGPETPLEMDLCRLLVSDNYLLTQLTTAGLSAESLDIIRDAGVPLLRRWALLAPFWDEVKYTGYALAHLITLRDIYGATQLADEREVAAVSERIAEDYAVPGLFRRVFVERCGIETVLTQGGYVGGDAPRMFHVVRPLDRADFSPDGSFMQDARAVGVEVKTVDDLAPAMDAILRAHLARGAVGIKIHALPWRYWSNKELLSAFVRVSKRQAGADPDAQPAPDDFPLLLLYVERIVTLAAEAGVPLAVHTGAPWTNWLDFRVWEPTALIPLLQTFRDTRFDLYHAGLPHGSAMSMLGMAFPNVWLNLTWAHIISREQTLRAIAEWLDQVPRNKVLGFGGDYQNPTVALTYGHLVLARRNLARVLAYRVHAGEISEDDCRSILRAWLVENPRRLYRC